MMIFPLIAWLEIKGTIVYNCFIQKLDLKNAFPYPQLFPDLKSKLFVKRVHKLHLQLLKYDSFSTNKQTKLLKYDDIKLVILDFQKWHYISEFPK